MARPNKYSSLMPTPSGGGSSPLTGAGSPVGVTTPDEVGQTYVDTTNGNVYVAIGTTNADWAFSAPTLSALSNTGNPNGVITPNGVGQVCVDITNGVPYINVDGTNTGWRAV